MGSCLSCLCNILVVSRLYCTVGHNAPVLLCVNQLSLVGNKLFSEKHSRQHCKKLHNGKLHFEANMFYGCVKVPRLRRAFCPVEVSNTNQITRHEVAYIDCLCHVNHNKQKKTKDKHEG